jgi:hypothetical protein
MPRFSSNPSLSKAARMCGFDTTRAKKRVLAKLAKNNAINRALMRMGNSEMMERIQFLQHRPLVKSALADPTIEFRQSLLNECKSLMAEEDQTSSKAGAKDSKQKKRKCTPLAMTLRPRTRSRRK